MAFKRSAVRSRLAPPKNQGLRFQPQAFFSFARQKKARLPGGEQDAQKPELRSTLIDYSQSHVLSSPSAHIFPLRQRSARQRNLPNICNSLILKYFLFCLKFRHCSKFLHRLPTSATEIPTFIPFIHRTCGQLKNAKGIPSFAGDNRALMPPRSFLPFPLFSGRFEVVFLL